MASQAVPAILRAFPACALRDRLEAPPSSQPWAIYLPALLAASRGPLDRKGSRATCGRQEPSDASADPGGARCGAAARNARTQPAEIQATGRVWRLAQDPKGSRLVQQALDAASSDGERLALASELRGHICEAIRCPHANHVVQKCITSLRPQSSRFILEELLRGGISAAAHHKYGCRIVQRLLEHLTPAQSRELCDALLAGALETSRHPYGNYVMQHLLEHGAMEHRERMVQELCRDAVGLGSNAYGAAVVAAGLAHAAPKGQLALARAVAKPPGLIEFMSCTRHGHMAVKSAILALEGAEQEQALRRVVAELKTLSLCRYGRALAVGIGLLPAAGTDALNGSEDGA